MPDAKDQTIAELLERRESCAGAHVESQLRRLGISVFVFAGNHRELKETLRQLSHPDSLELRTVENRPQHRQALQNVVRLLHNMLASVKTLVDHSRNVVRDLADAKLMDEHTVKVSKSFAVTEHCFLQKLRNFALHWALPPVVDTLHWEVGDTPGRGTIEMTVNLDATRLLEWDEWNREERDFIQGWEDGKVPLGVIIDGYARTVTEFYKWLFEALRNAHKNELDEFLAVNKELHERLSTDRGRHTTETVQE